MAHKIIIPGIWILLFLMSGTSNNLLTGQTVSPGKIKVALIYTVTTPELIEDMEREISHQVGSGIEMLIYEIPSVFHEITETGYVTAAPASTLIKTYIQAMEDGADAILSICSTVGDIAYSMQPVAKYIGVPIIPVNEEMCREAVRNGNKITIMATFPTAIPPTKNTLVRVAEEMGKPVEVNEVIIENGFGMEQATFKVLLADKANEIAEQTDVYLFAQGSMAYCQEYVEKRVGKTVLSNPYFAAKALKDGLFKKGLISE